MNIKLFNAISAIAIVCLISSCSVFKKTPEKTTTAVSAAPPASEVENTTTASSSGQIQTINAEQFNKLLVLDEVQLVDVRTPEEFQSGHIKDAENIDYNNENFKSKASSLDKSKPVLVYCRSGKRSASAAEILKEMGFTKIVSLDGGMISWEAANLPTSK
ncbi:rhodanese-like domain-containing protein [Albibacterium bauzanense]|uniref:Rhodanese-related sulfurtransferase n=1 Tax=Albibacterium bauzanense TaxID=653929 RepID=A0A4R1M0U5_9SPHI|nr:rhodanese-like domain-containing protein [Albibacterium bauzanense]TCK85546.1 rhodanese-related sulfurtransferase [Albibacterium bauzanense]